MTHAMEMRYLVTCFDPAIDRRCEYGRASDLDGAQTLVASLKAQERGLRNAHIELLGGQRDLFDAKRVSVT